MPDYTPLQNYRVIGDLRTAALVNNQARIDWLCLPDFDSPGIFNQILDNNGGQFSIDAGNYSTRCDYIKDTAIVATAFEGDDHAFTVRDFMVPQPLTQTSGNLLVRKLVGKSGNRNVTLTLSPRPQYGQIVPEGEHNDVNNVLTFRLQNGTVKLHAPQSAHIYSKKEGTYSITVPLDAGDTKTIVCTYLPHDGVAAETADTWETQTKQFWKGWIEDANTFSFCRSHMRRSAITLKLLQHHETGALVAAPTTSLPEVIGRGRNWDYRYCWIRDATFTLYSLLTLGLKKETKRFLTYISTILTAEEQSNEISDLTHFYTIHGNKVQAEYGLDHLSGYENSQPVRIGNSASKQFQLDTYGVMIDAFYLAQRDGLTLSGKHKRIIIKLLDAIADRWQEKDNGIWEVRGKRKHYTYSKVMCWVGVDRALKMRHQLPVDKSRIKELKQLRERIDSWVWNNCFDTKTQTLTQHPQTNAQDATNFLFPLVQFLDKDAEITNKIIENTQEELCHDDLFVYRYRNDDGLSGNEGAFVLCTFWMISALAKTEKTKEARKLFRAFESEFGDSGLFPEEINPQNGTYLGNYPQAFSHMGYIMSAYYIQKYCPDITQ